MAQTIQSLFPFTENRAEYFNIYPVYLKFSAPIVAGQYVFNETLTPSQVFGKLLQPQKGVIAGVMISANCSESQFTSAIDDPLYLQILHGGNKTPVNMAAFPFCNFTQGDNFQLQWKCSGGSASQEEDFLLQVSGKVNQLTGMTSNELELRIAFNFIRVGIDELKG